MAGAPTWPVEPAQRVGAFHLGMGVNEALGVVQRMGSLDKAEFSFDEQRPFDCDLSLKMPSLGLQFCFDGFQQDLRLISVCLQQTAGADSSCAAQEDAGMDDRRSSGSADEEDISSMLPTLSYSGRVFAGVQRPAPCLSDVYAMFGPTWIGDFQQGEHAAYFLRYPGVAFEFPLPRDMVDSLAARGEHPMQLPGRAPPVVQRLWVFAADSPSFLMPVSAIPDLPEAAIVRPAKGVELHGRMLRFGSMPQDVFSDFGPPEQVCVKDVDAVRIHSSRPSPARPLGPDYYYNYFHLGIDVLFDGHTHLLKKVILHTNPPTHELFSRYSRCFFQLPLDLPPGSPLRRPKEAENLDALAEEWRLPCAAVLEPPRSLDETNAGIDASGRAEEVTFHLEMLQDSAAPPESAAAATPEPEDTRRGADTGNAPANDEGGDDVRCSVAQNSPEDGLGEDLAEQQPFRLGGGRKISKRERKERKAAKKNKRNSEQASSAEASPEFSVPSSSAEPSPMFGHPEDEDGDCLGDRILGGDDGGVDGGPSGLEDLLPPPALPIEGLQIQDDGEQVESRPCANREGSSGGCASPLHTLGGSGDGHFETMPTLSLDGPAAGPSAAAADAAAVASMEVLPVCGGEGGSRGMNSALQEQDDLDSCPEPLCIDVRWSWPQIQDVLCSLAGCSCGKPLIMNERGHTPFGSTYFYAFPGLAFEVMQNDCLASLTVFSVPRAELPQAFQPRTRA